MEGFKVIQLDSNSWIFDGPVGRAYLFRGGQKALLVDTTMGPGNLKAEVKKLVGNMPVILVNTHGDSDHIGCNDQFSTALMHPAEFAYYAAKCKSDSAVPEPVEEGKKIDIGGRIFEVIYTPGHTYGCIMLLNRAERFLLSGDSIGKVVFIFGPQRNLRALIYSLKKIRDKYMDAFDTIYPAHFDLRLDKDFILKEIACAEALLKKEIEGIDPGEIPLEAPEFKPALLYMKDGSGIFDYKDLPY